MDTENRPVPQPAPWVATVLPRRRKPKGDAYKRTRLLPIGQVPSISTPGILRCERGAKWWA